MTDLQGISLVSERAEEYPNQRQLLDYRSQREDSLEWLLYFGKQPDRAEGYAYQTVKARAARMDIFYRWMWEQEDGYTATLTHEHGGEWLRHLAKQEKSNVHKANCRKAAQMLFKWRQHKHGLDEWDPDISFSSSESAANPRDYLTRDERAQIREAALEYGSIPAYGNLSSAQRQ